MSPEVQELQDEVLRLTEENATLRFASPTPVKPDAHPGDQQDLDRMTLSASKLAKEMVRASMRLEKALSRFEGGAYCKAQAEATSEVRSLFWPFWQMRPSPTGYPLFV